MNNPKKYNIKNLKNAGNDQIYWKLTKITENYKQKHSKLPKLQKLPVYLKLTITKSTGKLLKRVKMHSFCFNSCFSFYQTYLQIRRNNYNTRTRHDIWRNSNTDTDWCSLTPTFPVYTPRHNLVPYNLWNTLYTLPWHGDNFRGHIYTLAYNSDQKRASDIHLRIGFHGNQAHIDIYHLGHDS